MSRVNSRNCGYSRSRIASTVVLGVEMPRIDVVQRLLLREPLFLLAEAEAVAGELHQVFGVALIHDREVAREAGGRSELPEQTVARRVERPALHARRRGADEPLGAREHLVRGAAREREEQNPLGRNAALDQVGDAIDERARLAGSGAGDDEQRPFFVRGGRPLFGVQLRGDVASRFRDDAIAGRVDLRGGVGRLNGHRTQYRFGTRSG